MERRITVEHALQIWGTQLTEQADPRTHVATSELYDLAMQRLSPPVTEVILAHLYSCKVCQSEWRELLWDLAATEMTDELHDVRAAASQGPLGPIAVRTADGDGSYTVIVRPSASPGDPTMITVEVDSKDRERLEGQTIQLITKQRRVLLQGEIVAGAVSQFVEGEFTHAEFNNATVRPVNLPSEEA